MSNVANRVDNSQDIVDSRDVIARIEELQDERDNYEPGDDDAADPDDTSIARIAAVQTAWAEVNPDEAEELKTLLVLQDEAEGYAADWHHGEALIRDSYFKDYAEHLADDIGAINTNASWPLNCIDWDEAARQLQQDYTSVDWGGVTYWIR